MLRVHRGVWALVLLALVVPAQGAWSEPLALKTLHERLVASGRAEAGVRQVVTMEGDTIRRLSGRLALEPPDRLRVDDTVTGERLTVRRDGGEWLQPAAAQMLTLRAEQAAQVAGIWRTLLESPELVEERDRGPRSFVLRARAGGEVSVDSLKVTLSPDGLPSQIRAFAGAEHWSLTFAAWKFGKPRGVSAFRIKAPTGYAVIEWP